MSKQRKMENLLVMLLLLVFSAKIDAQALLEIRGRIIDSSTQETIPGASIIIEGTKTGTMSSDKGEFFLKAQVGQIMVISSIGYKTERIQVVYDKKNYDCVLHPDFQMLEESIAIGYGTQNKRDLSGSIGTISQKKMENQATPGIGQNLQGKLAGVTVVQSNGTPYSGVGIRLRGVGSFGASSSPLIVVDGMITNDGLSNLNPDDVEDITVLKDASSAAIYGSRGANGVIIITTKSGRYEQPLKISANAYYAMDSFRKKIELLTAKEYAEVVNDYYRAASLPVPFSDSEVASYGKGTNWLDEISQNGLKQDYSVSITGGTEKNQYAVAMNLYNGKGLIRNTDFTRGNIKLTNEMKLLPALKLGVSLGINYGKSNNTNWGSAIANALIYPPTVPAYDENGDYGVSTHHGEPITMVQPLIYVDLEKYDQTWKKFLGNTYIDWEIIKGLVLRSTIFAEYTHWYQDYFNPSYSYGPAGLVCDHPTASLSVSSNQHLNYEWDNVLTYSKTFNHDHSITAMIGYTFQDATWNNLGASRSTFLNNDKLLQVLSAGTSAINNSGSKAEFAIQSFLARINYDFRHKYLFTASARVDQTSRISKEYRTGVFPGASAAWVLSEENFMKSLPAVSFMKLRLSWGVLGNQEIGNYPYQTTLTNNGLYYPFGSGNEGTIYTGVGPTSYVNNELKWEKTMTYGVGFDANFFNSKLSVITDLYLRNTSDILVRVPILATSGVAGSSPYQNVGACVNKGVELTLGYTNASDNKEFTYDMSVNWAYNRNEVTSIPNAIVNAFSRTEVGHSINEWYGYVADGIFQNEAEIQNWATQPNAEPGDIKFKDLNGDNVINADDRDFIGKSVAPHTFGANLSASFKGFDFAASLYGQVGAKVSIDAVSFALLRGGEQTSAWMYRQRWTGEGTSNYVPRVTASDPNDNYRRSSFWLRSSDFMRMQNIQIGYDFHRLLKGRPAERISKLRLYAAAQNLFCINSYPGFDPEQGINVYPIPRSIYLGLNLGL